MSAVQWLIVILLTFALLVFGREFLYAPPDACGGPDLLDVEVCVLGQ